MRPTPPGTSDHLTARPSLRIRTSCLLNHKACFVAPSACRGGQTAAEMFDECRHCVIESIDIGAAAWTASVD